MDSELNNSKVSTLGTETGYTSRPYAYAHDFYLTGEILEAENYNEWFDVIRRAGSDDVITIHINSPGGSLYTAIQFLRVINESDATLVTSVEGACMSAATMIFLQGDRLEVTPHSLFMFHNYSGGAFGKGGEMFDQVSFQKEWSEKLLRDTYQDFLTEDEIVSMLHGRDIWMNCDQVLERVKQAIEKRKSTQAEEEQE